jgi:predicted SAM-dependent methyltransferase
VKKLNIGDGGIEIPGYEGVDIKRGYDAVEIQGTIDDTYDEIRASHVLEHFPHRKVSDVIKEWVRVLKPGGVLKIAVPDFEMIARQYLSGAPLPTEGYVMGGQVDDHDFHKALFDRETLADLLRQSGLVAIRSWKSEIKDCASLPISLNLCGTKPPTKWPKVSAVISMPRLGFNDFWACAYQELASIGVGLHKTTGAYWDRDLANGIEKVLGEESPEWILTCDYDTVFTRQQVFSLLDVAMRYPHADAIAPLQTARHHNAPMFTARSTNGELAKDIDREVLEKHEVVKAETAHFGLTLLRASKLLELRKPWFRRTYSLDGELTGDDARDPDVNFWHHWKDAGNTLYVALRVPVGHCELMIRWPDINLDASFQRPSEFWAGGPPDNVWR